MAQVFVFGTVLDELEAKKSQRGTDYLSFRLRETVRKGQFQTYQVWAWGADVSRLIRHRVHCGSMIWLSGSLWLVDSTTNRGRTPQQQLKVALSDWGFVPGSQPGCPPTQTPAEQEQPSGEPAFSAGILNGDRDALPE